jgi:2-alkyl-3-oxoalkanoate reductase
VATRGWLPLIDEGRAVIDLTYVDNAADAVVAAAEAPGHAAGRVYNITNGEPCTVVALFEQIIATLGLRVRLVRVPFPLAYLGAATLEALTLVLPGRPEPPLTRYTLGMIARSQTLSIDAARRDLGYHPNVSLADGIRRTLEQARLP